MRNETQLILPGPVGELETVLSRPTNSTPRAVGLMCHPHPLHGGTMNNKVVTTVVRTWVDLDVVTLRFNYRGVGQSEGEYGHMEGEIEDAFTLFSWLQSEYPTQPIWLAGFSFGSCVSASLANRLLSADNALSIQILLSVAPPVNHYDFLALKNISCPWVVIQGDQDGVVSAEEVVAWHKKQLPQPELVMMPGASHFFHGQLGKLQEIIKEHAP